MATVVAEVP